MNTFEQNIDEFLTQSEKHLLTTHTTDPSVWKNKKNIEILQKILTRIPTTQEEITLYSGAEIPISQYIFGSPLNLNYFTSSYCLNVAEKYAQMYKCLFILTVPKGSKIICLDKLSAHGDSEHEVLLSGIATLHVTQIEYKEKYLVVHTIYQDT
jgi:hypothetical protein